MSLPSQGKGPTRGPKVEVRDSKRRGGGVNPTIIVIGVVVVVALVWGGISLLGGGPGKGTTKQAATPADPNGTQAAARPQDADTPTASNTHTPTGGDPALDSILGSGSSRPAGSGLLAQTPSTPATRPAAITDPVASPTIKPETGTPIAGDVNPGEAGDEGEALPAVATADGALPITTVRKSTADAAIETARTQIDQNQLVEARKTLNRALVGGDLPAGDQARVRDQLKELNSVLVFSPRVVPGDTMSEEYKVEAGDSLAKIARKRELATHWKLIARVNGIDDPRRIRVGQRLKLVRGPFHAVVDKSEYRMDLYQGPPESPKDWTYVTSVPVGLGLDDGTPVGSFVVSQGKLENPGWVNPRDSRERYDRDDPKNPIGEYWIGLDGIGASAEHKGYGIHGTIDPGSIGKSVSMGCVRLRDDDIELVYELLTEGVSVVHIVP